MMNKYMREHRKVFIVLAIFITLVIAIFIAYKFIFENSKSKYGDRLAGIEKVKLSNSKTEEIEGNINSLNITQNIKIELSGKIINVIAVVNDDIDTTKAKEIYDKVSERLTEKQKKFYDIQIFIKKNTKDEKFPIIGYKHHNNDYMKWTQDR